MPDVPVNLPGNEPIDPGFGNPGSEEGQIDPEFGVTPPVYGGPVDPGFGNPGSEEGQRPQPPVENPIERPIDPGYDGPIPPVRPQPPVENPIERPIDPGWGHTPPARPQPPVENPIERPIDPDYGVTAPPAPQPPAGAGTPVDFAGRFVGFVFPVDGEVDPGFGHTPPPRPQPPVENPIERPIDPGYDGPTPPARPQPPVENPIERPIDPGFGHTPPAPLCGMADCPLRPVQLEPLTAHVVNSSGSDGIGWRELTAVVGAIFITVNALTDTSLTSTAKLWIDAGLAILVAILFVAR